MPKIVLVPYNRKSGAIKRLASKLSEKVGYKVFRVTPEKVRRRIPICFKQGTDKLTQLNKFKADGVPHPEFSSSRDDAAGWLRDNGVVVCRTLLRSSEGKGIVIAENESQIVPAPLYTKYFKKKKEFRVHVYNGEVIDVQEKRKKSNYADERDTRVRNLANGYVFARNGINEPVALRETALAATRSLGYNLGAVDIAYNERHNKLVVLEVNANPGMEGTTLDKYADAILKGVN